MLSNPTIFQRIRERVAKSRYDRAGRREINIDVWPGIVSFTFDDFPASAADAGARILEAHGWRGTYYVASGMLGTDTPLGKTCTMDDVERLWHGGHEIGSHTHAHLRCEGASHAALLADYTQNLKSLGRFGDITSFALPFGAHDHTALNFFRRCFDTIRTVRPGVNRGRCDLNRLTANAIYQSTDMEKLRSQIDETRAEGGWLIFYTHDVCDNPSPFGCTAERFEAILRLVDEAGLDVATMREAHGRLVQSVVGAATPVVGGIPGYASPA